MNHREGEDAIMYQVVVNHEEQYSLWPVDETPPTGWKIVGPSGPREECLAYIRAVWTDMRPLSLRMRMNGNAHASPETQGDCVREACIHYLFEDQVEHSPDHPAAVFEDSHLTYRELNRKANQLAHHLQNAGVGPEVTVGLCVERSLDMVVGILGIFKAGGTYVPMDPLYPVERLTVMAKDARLSLLVTEKKIAPQLRGCVKHLVCLDRDWSEISRQAEENPRGIIPEQALSHIIYTSGSTGIPKGAMVAHASLFHNVQAIQSHLGISSDDAYLHTASLAFTSSLRQLLLPLSRGASVVITNAEQRTNPLQLFDLIKRRRVTTWDTVAVFWESCAYALTRLDPRSRAGILNNRLRLILSSGGELLSTIPVNWRSELQHGARLVNMYGQAETIGNTLVYPIPDEYNASFRAVPLGPPIAHNQLYLLDDRLKPVADGVPAELHMGGLSLARGYINRPDLTAGKFVPHPFSLRPGDRLYRTGDKGRRISAETIEFLGRVDNQIKIRGYRIEIGDVEATLKRHPGICEAAVIAKEDGPGDTYMLAYFVPGADPAPTDTELHSFLNGKLPEYMVPSAFVQMDTLPRMPNSKIDRQALADRDYQRPVTDKSYVAPKTGLERYLSQLWCDVLALERVGVESKFFELGGNSIKAARLINRLQHELGESLYIISLFEAPSVREYAAFLSKQYPQAVAKRFPQEFASSGEPRPQSGRTVTPAASQSRRQHAARLQQLRRSRHPAENKEMDDNGRN